MSESSPCLLCSQNHHTDDCPTPAMLDIWYQLLFEVNSQDVEDDRYDSVRWMLEREIDDEMLSMLSVRFGNGTPTESRQIHIDRIMTAVRNFVQTNWRNSTAEIPNVAIDPNQCALHLIPSNEESSDVLLECSICYEDVFDINTVSLGCQHEFCNGCLIQHIRQNPKNCPMCREPIKGIITKLRESFDEITEILSAPSIQFDEDDSIPDLISDNESINDIPELIPADVMSVEESEPESMEVEEPPAILEARTVYNDYEYLNDLFVNTNTFRNYIPHNNRYYNIEQIQSIRTIMNTYR